MTKEKEIECYVCKTTAQTYERNYGDKKRFSCPQCGEYEISRSLLAATTDFNKVKPYILSAFIRKQNDSGTVPILYTYDMDKIAAYPEMPLVEKIDALLLSFANDLQKYTQKINIEDKKHIARICAQNEQEYVFVLDILHSKGLIDTLKSKEINQSRNPFQNCTISASGWIYVQSLKHKANSTQGFVAMWFDPSMDEIYKNGIEPAFKGTGFSPLKINDKLHNDKIDDQIIAEIQRSRFIVADFTGSRSGVYFEAGYAMGRGIPVIWTCKDCCIKDLHFDIRQYNMINWKDSGDLKERLHQRIRATIG